MGVELLVAQRCDTAEERAGEITDYALGLVDAARTDTEVNHAAAHIDRLRLIFAPFPAVRRIGSGCHMAWAGVLIGDPNANPAGRMAGMSSGEDGDVMARYYDGHVEHVTAEELAALSDNRQARYHGGKR